MRDVSDANTASGKWAARASLDPFAAVSPDASSAFNGPETATQSQDQALIGKENRLPRSGEQLPSSLLGKRPNPAEDAPPKPFYAENEARDVDRARRDLQVMANAVTHFESRSSQLHGVPLGLDLEEEEQEQDSTMLVDDFSHTGLLRFGSVALGEKRSKQLTLENPSDLGNARIKYEDSAQLKTRFKCDLHLCVVDALKSVTLRVTFEPLAADVGRQVTAMLRFTVNDTFKLQCRATGIVTPRVPRSKRRKSEPRMGMAKALTPRKCLGASQDPPSAKKPFSGSWWKQRQEVYDENWMAKQTEDGTAQRLGGGEAQDDVEDQPSGVRRRFNFSSLRVLAQKRMESKWAQAAVELYHLPSMDDILFNLQDEIGNQKLLFRADRPVYADVGLQEELISLLNNYHPVWLCLGLYAVLGSQVMRQEKCSLRSIFSTTTVKLVSQGKKASPPDRKMPRVLRRIILKHLVKDSHVAQNYRLVNNLMTPLDGSTADRNDGGNAFKNTKKNINGREYFDSLTQSFMLKFLMLVIFLDRAIEHKADKFAHFPCLFRIASSTKKTASGRIDKHLKLLGYILKHEQTALDEIDLEIKSLETDLRDGSNNDKGEQKHRLNGRVRVSSSGFAGLRSKVDEKMVENLAKDIVNGHREKTLALLWKLISSFQLQSLVDAQTMRQEIANVAKRMSFQAKDFFDVQQQNAPLDHANEHEYAQQLSEKTLLSNEQRHFAIINDRIKQLGEVPVLMPQQYNTKNPPEEKLVVTFVCYLQSRLMDSYGEIHAASRLKRWWKSPFIRLRMHRKKNANARIIQRFWYTSNKKRLAIRQCRKLLRAAHLVKSTARMWLARRRYIRFLKSVVAIQRAFRARRQLQINGDSAGAVLVIQYHWRKQLECRREKDRQLHEVVQRKVARRTRVKESCAIIERNWLQYLSREGARLLRQQMIADRHYAATRIQAAWQQGRMCSAARKQRMQTWRQVRCAARVIQRAWSTSQLRREERQRVLALQCFEEMMKEKELQKKQFKLKRKVETRAAKCVQKGFRNFALRRPTAFRGTKQKLQYRKEKRAAAVLQRNVRAWRRRRQVAGLLQFYRMLKTYQRMKATEEQRRKMQLQELKHKVETRAAHRIQAGFRSCRFQKQTLAATRIQSLARSCLVRSWYSSLRQSVCLLQKNVRIWRRRRQLCALLREEEERQEGIRKDRLRRLQESVEHRAAYRIQSMYRFYAHHKRMLAAIVVQAAFRGSKEKQQYSKTRSGIMVVQRAIRSWLAVAKFQRALYVHRAAVSIQKCARGWISRRHRFNFYALQTQLQRLRVLISCWQIQFWFANRMMKHRKKRTLLVRARWTQLRAGIIQKRIADANKIALCWRSFCLRNVVNARIQRKQQMDTAAQRVQVWWLGLCCKWAERQRRAEEKRHRELVAMALAMAKTRAERIVGMWLRQNVIIPYRERNFHYVAVRKVQAWWRGTLVRLHYSTPQITQQRKKLSKMKLPHEERSVQTEQPQTLGARLDMALHMLLHGKRLQDMLFASHTIEVCTRYSRECCRKCVQLQISSTIFAAIRGLNRSRPHVELLHQLLLVLKNLTVYRRSIDKIKPMRTVVTDDADGRLEVDLRALDTLVDLLHIHRDMHHVFVLSATVITYYLGLLKPLAAKNAGVHESWSEAEKRLGGLLELLSRKLALYNATASFRRVNQIPEKSNANNLMRKMNPKTAVSIMEKLTVLLER
uniref:Abnormal spindle-like microcephaly-associated protein ASH domain-containing protein n=1 Tax=Phytophthora ramorum TaxID=164328 RepID=H3HBC6_PHYRM